MRDFTVLGLLGPAGSGKDLTADWFVSKGFVKVAFADPMKRFVLQAFGIDWDRLWGPSEKRNETFQIPDAWWFEAIGHLGKAAEEIVQEVLPEGVRVEGYLKLHDWFSNLRKSYPTEISARVILQTLGTEWGRAVDPIMWSRYAHKIAYELQLGGHSYTQTVGLKQNTPGQNDRCIGVIIPDHRFWNEITYTRDRGGYVVRLRRLAMEKPRPDIGVAGHVSEAEHKEIPDRIFDAVYELPEGVDKVNALLEDTYSMKPWARKWDRTNELECNIVRYDPISSTVV